MSTKSAKYRFLNLSGAGYERRKKFVFSFRGGVFVYFLPKQKVKNISIKYCPIPWPILGLYPLWYCPRRE